MKLRDIMTKDVTSVTPDTTIYDCAVLMKEQNIGSLPVCSNRKDVEGIVTDRDIVLRVVAANKDARQMKAREIMTNDLIVGKTDMEIASAAQLMADTQVRRLPVVEGKQLVGFVSLGDIATENSANSAAEEALTQISIPSKPKK